MGVNELLIHKLNQGTLFKHKNLFAFEIGAIGVLQLDNQVSVNLFRGKNNPVGRVWIRVSA